jgi:molybdate transport system permease protein
VHWSFLWFSLRVAGLATAISLILGAWFGYILPGKRAAAVMLTLPLAFPPTIICSYFLVTKFTWEIAVVAACIYALPFLARSARTVFRTLNSDYTDAARSLGSSEWGLFWRVALPLTFRPLLAAAGIVFARVLTETLAIVWIAGGSKILP